MYGFVAQSSLTMILWYYPQLFRRRPRYLTVDVAVLNQLVTPREVIVTQTASTEDEPYVAINNAILRRVRLESFLLRCEALYSTDSTDVSRRQHFRKLTKRFLRPFDPYFGVWKINSTNSNLYVSPEDVLKPFDLKVNATWCCSVSWRCWCSNLIGAFISRASCRA
jgi:hypothetical protein